MNETPSSGSRSESARISERLVHNQEVSIAEISLLTDWYDVDIVQVLKIMNSALSRHENGAQMGIYTEVVLAALKSDDDTEKSEYRIGDGYHRTAATIILAAISAESEGKIPPLVPYTVDEEGKITLGKGFNFEAALPNIVKAFSDNDIEVKIRAAVDHEATFASLWEIRTTALMGPHHRVRAARLIKLVNRTWQDSEWGETPFRDALRAAVNHKLKLQRQQSKPIKRNDAIPEQVEDLDVVTIQGIEYLIDLAEKWELGIERMSQYFDMAENLDDRLVSLVRTNAIPGEVPISTAEVLANAFPKGAYQKWQWDIYTMPEQSLLRRIGLKEFCQTIYKIVSTCGFQPDTKPVDFYKTVVTNYNLWSRRNEQDKIIDGIMIPFRKFFISSPASKNAAIRSLPWQILYHAGIDKYTLEEVTLLRDEILKELIGLSVEDDFSATAAVLSELIEHHRQRLDAVKEESKLVAVRPTVELEPRYIEARNLRVAEYSGSLPERVPRSAPVSQFRLMSDILYIMHRAHMQRNSLEDRGAVDGTAGVPRLRGQEFDDFLELSYRTIIQFGASHLDSLEFLSQTVELTMEYLKFKDKNPKEANAELLIAQWNRNRRLQK